MCGGVVPPYANAEMETWSYPCVPFYNYKFMKLRAASRCREKGVPPFPPILMQSE